MLKDLKPRAGKKKMDIGDEQRLLEREVSSRKDLTGGMEPGGAFINAGLGA